MWPIELCLPEKGEELGVPDTLPPCALVDGMDTPPAETTMLGTTPEFSILELSTPHWPSGAGLLTVLEQSIPTVGLHIPENDSILEGRHLLLLPEGLVSS